MEPGYRTEQHHAQQPDYYSYNYYYIYSDRYYRCVQRAKYGYRERYHQSDSDDFACQPVRLYGRDCIHYGKRGYHLSLESWRRRYQYFISNSRVESGIYSYWYYIRMYRYSYFQC